MRRWVAAAIALLAVAGLDSACNALLDIKEFPAAGDEGDGGFEGGARGDATGADAPSSVDGPLGAPDADDDGPSCGGNTCAESGDAGGDATSGDASGDATSGDATSGDARSGDGGGGADAAEAADAGSPRGEDAGDSGVEAGPVEGGSVCGPLASQTFASKIQLGVSWPSTVISNAGTSTLTMVTVTSFTGSTTLTGTTQFCSITFPDVALNAVGQLAASSGTKMALNFGVVTEPLTVPGMQSGGDPGDTLNSADTVFLLGLTSASPEISNTVAWPPACATGMCAPSGSFASGLVFDADDDGAPGYTATPTQTSGYALLPTTTTSGALADRVYMALRIELAVNQARSDCMHSSGTAFASLLDTHVVGCHATCPGGASCASTGTCTSDQAQFLDDNRTIFGYDAAMGDLISPAHQVSGMAQSVLLANGASCAAALSAF